MRIHIARSVFETMATLEQAVQSDRSARAQGAAWISEPFKITMETHLLNLREASASHSLMLQSLNVSIEERRFQMIELTRLVRDFYQVLKRRGQRLGNGEPVAALYGRPKRIPHSAPVTQWLEWANAIVLGEKQALAHGYPAMVNPSAQDIEAALTRASASQVRWSQAQQAIKTEEQRLREARNHAGQSLRGLARRLREVLRNEPAPTRRELMRTYGFSFISTGAKDPSPANPEQSIFQRLPQVLPLPVPKNNIEPMPAKSFQTEPLLASPIVAPGPAVAKPENEAKQKETQPAVATIEIQPPQPKQNQPAVATIKIQPSQPAKALLIKHCDDPKAPPNRAKKLSRREKKALRRAMAADPGPHSRSRHLGAIMPHGEPSLPPLVPPVSGT